MFGILTFLGSHGIRGDAVAGNVYTFQGYIVVQGKGVLVQG